ncbi:MAG: DUF3349 domain-containing protein [Mycobacteriaceae bacterium]|nr:DUF3349 domain-containing protein [Mycobacteriaceae bacterium]
MKERQNFFECVLHWLNAGYPQGVPEKDYFPLLALLKRTLSEDEVVQAALSILKNGDSDTPVTDEQIREAIRDVTEHEPNPEQMNQVASRLASVGWPLAPAAT